MTPTKLSPVFSGIRLGLHALLVGLTAFAVVRAFVVDAPGAIAVLVTGTMFVGVYLAGAWTARTRGTRTIGRRSALTWIAALTLLWAVLTGLSPEGAYLVFPLFFLYLYLLPGHSGVIVVVATTVFAILALGFHFGFSVGGVVGPLIGAGVALLIGWAYTALRREAEERERLMAELLRTRQQLAETEREQGTLTERARLAREIHDTVAQGLSSIQMLLRAAERDAADPGAGYIRLARETAADSLADTRQIIHELTPTRLGDGLPSALRRLAREQSARAGIRVDADVEDVELPMQIQTALLRIAQGALSNVVRHAHATEAHIELTCGEGEARLIVRDNGSGFAPAGEEPGPHEAGSFGLSAMQERAEQLEGTLDVASLSGNGTTVTARLPLPKEHQTP